MRTLGDLLAARRIAELIVPVTEGGRDRAVACVSCAETLAQLEDAPVNSVIVLTGAASTDIATYRLDIAIRVADSRGVAALVLIEGGGALPGTAVAIADRAEIALLRVAQDADLAAVVLGLNLELTGGAPAALTGARAALMALRAAEEQGAGPDELVDVAGQAIGAALSWRAEDEGSPAASTPETEQRAEVRGSDGRHLVVTTRRAVGSEEGAIDLVLQLAADAVARSVARAQRAADIPVRSNAQLLSELLVASPDRLGPLLHRARAIGMPIDGWHVVVSIEVDELPSDVRDDEVGSFELRERIAAVALDTARSHGGAWYRASSGSTLLLIRMARDDPTPASPAVATATDRVLRRLSTRVSGLSLFCGIGTPHETLQGLRASVAEAGAAVAAAKTGGKRNTAVSFDAVGLRRMLVEWYASETARRAVESILAPLESLGPNRSETAINTLQAYLDNQGSLTRTAQALHLHRNAVAYRLKRILEVLDVDLDNPDERLVLQLACRTRALA